MRFYFLVFGNNEIRAQSRTGPVRKNAHRSDELGKGQEKDQFLSLIFFRERRPLMHETRNKHT